MDSTSYEIHNLSENNRNHFAIILLHFNFLNNYMFKLIITHVNSSTFLIKQTHTIESK